LLPILSTGPTRNRHLGSHADHRYRTKLPEFDYNDWLVRSVDLLDRYDLFPLSNAEQRVSPVYVDAEWLTAHAAGSFDGF
jgi:hypothetical protein